MFESSVKNLLPNHVPEKEHPMRPPAHESGAEDRVRLI
jgi:hypothetical protein